MSRSGCGTAGGFVTSQKSPIRNVQPSGCMTSRSGEKSVVIAPEILKLPPEEPKAVELVLTPEEEAAKAEDKFLPVPGYQWSQDETQILLSRPARHRGFNEGDKSLYVYTVATKELLKSYERRSGPCQRENVPERQANRLCEER